MEIPDKKIGTYFPMRECCLFFYEVNYALAARQPSDIRKKNARHVSEISYYKSGKDGSFRRKEKDVLRWNDMDK